MRVLGDAYLKALATRDLIRTGYVEGPEMLVSAGHIRPRLGEPFILSFPQFGQYLNDPLTGPDNVRAVAVAVIARGADVLKVGASERAGLANTDPRRQELSYEEMTAVVEEATRAGLYVAAHAHDRQGANAAVRAGVRSIEHGTYLDDETLALMKAKGTFLVPTRAIMSPLGDPRGDGADAHEFVELGAVGLTPAEAISAATYQSARALGIDHRTGSIAVGLEADLLVVERDPRADTSTLYAPLFVVSNGRSVVNRLY